MKFLNLLCLVASIGLLLLLLLVVLRLVSNRNQTLDYLPMVSRSSYECRLMAVNNCQMPVTQDDDCWLHEYEQCANQCRINGVSPVSCGCYEKASQTCLADNGSDMICAKGLYDQCMASRGFGQFH